MIDSGSRYESRLTSNVDSLGGVLIFFKLISKPSDFPSLGTAFPGLSHTELAPFGISDCPLGAGSASLLFLQFD